uniref:Reverse transcriptase domain-containing protein n=1 Tax=Amphiprion percula TaxID=161767 RepID=A0A3P8RLF1_AMPPE
MQSVQKTLPQYGLRSQIQRQAPEDTEGNMAAGQTADPQIDMALELTTIKTLLQGVASDMTGLKSGMDAVQAMVEKLGSRLAEAEVRISALEDEGRLRGNAAETAAATIKQLQERVAYLEDAGRRNNVRIVGVEEGTEGKDLNVFISSLLSETLNIEMTRDFEIERSYRAGPRRSGDRHIIVRFLKLRAREEVLRAAREKGRVERQGKRISFFQDLSQDIIQRGVAILTRKNLNIKVHKQYSDKDGRWVAIDVDLFGVRYSLINIYAPNTDSPEFFIDICNIAKQMGNLYVIIGGDFNQIRDPALDKSSSTNNRPKQKSVLTVDTMVEELGLVDIWRLLYSHEREYTFYSNPHSTYSRIDYFLISKQLVGMTVSASIANIVLSDHAPVETVLSLGPRAREPMTRWRLNTSLLQNETSSKLLKQEIFEYWDQNEGTASNPGLEWDAFKAYLRGRLIQHCSFLKKQSIRRLQELEREIKDLEKIYAHQPNLMILSHLSKLKFELNSILQKKVEFALFQCKQRYYEQGEAAGKFLAQRVKQQYSCNLIPAVENEEGTLVTDTGEINETFKLFYKKLYTSQCNIDQDDIDHFLSRVHLPSLSIEEQRDIGGDITLEEVKQAIKKLSAGKSPGDDGFPTDFYKAFSDILAPRLLKVFQDALQRGSIPESMQSIVITLIHKKGKNPLQCGSYRPVSLINVDAKILAKILATRLEKFLPSLIHPDQVGFVKGRHSADNVRRLLHLMWQEKDSAEPRVAFSLDAEKAFDRVEWAYLFRTLHGFGLGSSFINWVKLLYHSPRASVLTNGRRSTPFPLFRGTRQGCPLSPLIFALALEPLAIAIRDNINIKGIKAGQVEHKLLLYADDILLVSTNPEVAVPHMLSVIGSFATISGYKVNWGKSEAMPLSKGCLPEVRRGWQFRWLPSGLTYLGIYLTPGLKDIMEENLLPLILKIESKLQNWDKLRLSLLGKINILKMIVVPQINYIIYMLPLNFPLPVLKKFNKIVETFLWSGKRPSLNRTKLYAAKEDGGLGMPRVDWYHYAFSLNQLSKIYGADGQIPAWVSIERELTEPPLLRFARETWRTSHQIVGSKPLFTRRSSLWNNKLLKVGRKALFWRTWTEAGIIYIEDVLEGDKFISFEQIMTKYHIPKTDFWKYLQLRSCLLSMQKRTPLIKQTLVQEMIQANQLTKKTASAFYSLMRQSHPPGLSGLKRMWKDITGSWYKISREMKTRLIIYKIIHRCYWTPCKMAKLKLRDSDLCWRCHRSKGTLLHMLYDCYLTQNLWKTIIGFVNKVLGTKFVQNPALCTLGIGVREEGLTVQQTLWCRLALSTGCRIVLRHWKTDNIVSFSEWMGEMTKIANFEQSIFKINNKLNIFQKIWGPFMVESEHFHSIYSDFHSIYSDFHSIYSDFHSIYSDFHSIYSNFHSIYSDFHSIYSNFHSIYSEF